MPVFRDDDPDDLHNLNEGTPGPPEELEKRPDRGEIRTREVKVVGVFEDVPQNYFVLLRDNRDRQLPILIGQFEAHSIAIALHGDRPMRPLTHDLLKNTVERLGAKIDSLTIDDLWHETYYAKLTLAVGDKVIDVDTRPSDGIAVVLRAQAPIYVAESVLEEIERHEEQEDED